MVAKFLKNIIGDRKIQQKKYVGDIYQTYFHQAGRPIWMNRNYDKFSDEGFSKNVIVYRCISMVSRAVASVPFKLNAKTSEGKKEINSHQVINLLSKPNQSQNSKLFLETLIAYRMISGNSYILSVKSSTGEVRELHCLRPDRVSILTDNKGHIAAYTYQNNGNEIKYPIDKITGDCDVLHLKNFHPLNDHFGLSPIEAAAYSIDQHNNAAKWNQSLLQNGAKPSGALVVKTQDQGGVGSLTDEQFHRIKNQIEDQYSGQSNAGRPILLEGGLDWKEMSLSPKDMDYIEAKNNSAREIALAFGVPPQLLGIPGDNTYSNLAEARLAFWENTIIPMAEELFSSLNNWLLPKFPNARDFYLSSYTDQIPALLPRKEKLWQRLQEADFLTDDEKREMIGLVEKSE